MLAVVVLEFGMEVRGNEVWQRRVGGAGIVETIARHAAGGAVGEHVHVLVVTGVAQAGGAKLTRGQGQLVEVVGDYLRPFEGLRQQAGVVAEGDRQGGGVGSHGEHGFSQPGLGGRPDEAKLIGHLAIPLHLQGAGSARATPGVQLDAQQPQGVHAETQGAFGKSRAVAKHEALPPFLGLGLALALETGGIDSIGVPVVAIHVEIAGFQAQLAVFDESCLGRERGETEQGQCVEVDATINMHGVYLYLFLLAVMIRPVTRNFLAGLSI
ncbi:hypothetical protein D3C84_392410 [compost metagenome]